MESANQLDLDLGLPPTPWVPSYRATKCPCGHPSCTNWLVAGVADVAGVSFTKAQAEGVAEVLNAHPEWAIGNL